MCVCIPGRLYYNVQVVLFIRNASKKEMLISHNKPTFSIVLRQITMCLIQHGKNTGNAVPHCREEGGFQQEIGL